MIVKCFDIMGEKYNISCIAYEPFERGAEFAVLCIHGFGGDKKSSAIKLLGEKITEAGGAVISFDLASHGDSEADEKMLTMENCISDTKTVYAYAENKYGRTDLFATSFGAFILINMLKTLDIKGSKAVLRSPAVRMADTFLSPICNLTIDELEMAGTVECGFERRMDLGYSFWQDLTRHSIVDATFENKCLMIYGDCDDVVKPSDMETFARGRENIDVLVIEGADHRFKKKGQLEAVIAASAEFLLN